MFGLFKKKSPLEQLEEQYKKALEEAFKLSKVNRAASDQKYQEAEDLAKQMDALRGN